MGLVVGLLTEVGGTGLFGWTTILGTVKGLSLLNFSSRSRSSDSSLELSMEDVV